MSNTTHPSPTTLREVADYFEREVFVEQKRHEDQIAALNQRASEAASAAQPLPPQPYLHQSNRLHMLTQAAGTIRTESFRLES